ncbi:argininosuccinate synthase [Candidatus Micrarchaeota archaeon]|nr:argininosuccinate synthase [Candidatus Micrarchaeota archaeon]
MDGKKKIVLAFSGGLDTSYCVIYLKEKYDADVITVTVDTGGFSPKELKEIEEKAKKLGAVKHYTINAVERVYNEFITYLIKGNVLRGGAYPLSVGAERVVQAEEALKIAEKEGAYAIAHGSTGAGNDQVRFDAVVKVRAPQMEIIAPIREHKLSREEEIKFLNERGFPINAERKKYSINQGIWGTTIGGGETHDSWQHLPEEAYTKTTSIEKAPDEPVVLEIEFKKGVPIALNGKEMNGTELVKKIDDIGGKHGVGRGMHLGDTIIGIKGRVAFEAPAPWIIIAAHKELEKLVLSKKQIFWKDHLGNVLGELLHEAQWYDPAVKDIKAMIDSSQESVTGIVRVKLFKGNIQVQGCKGPYSMMNPALASYGEGTKIWNGKDAEGFCKVFPVSQMIARGAKLAGSKSKKGDE